MGEDDRRVPADADVATVGHAVSRLIVVKGAAYLQRGVSVVIIDAVTERLANMHEELINLLQLGPGLGWSSNSSL